MSVAINENCGIKIPLISFEESIEGFYQGINRLVKEKDLLQNLKVGARKRSLELSWDSMAEEIVEDYIKIYHENTVNK
jgi:glycosyltransferase involved in cell wall biosynthesis